MPTIDPLAPASAALPSATPAVPGAGDGEFAQALVMARSRGTPALTDRRHLSLDNSEGKKEFEEKALHILAFRQQTIAANIANADTPGFKARDLNVQQAMLDALNARPQLPLSGQHRQHLAATPPHVTSSLHTQYQIPAQGAVDGNTVEMDSERAKFAENALRYKFAHDQIADDYAKMQKLFQSMKE